MASCTCISGIVLAVLTFFVILAIWLNYGAIMQAVSCIEQIPDVDEDWKPPERPRLCLEGIKYRQAPREARTPPPAVCDIITQNGCTLKFQECTASYTTNKDRCPCFDASLGCIRDANCTAAFNTQNAACKTAGCEEFGNCQAQRIIDPPYNFAAPGAPYASFANALNYIVGSSTMAQMSLFQGNRDLEDYYMVVFYLAPIFFFVGYIMGDPSWSLFFLGLSAASAMTNVVRMMDKVIRVSYGLETYRRAYRTPFPTAAPAWAWPPTVPAPVVPTNAPPPTFLPPPPVPTDVPTLMPPTPAPTYAYADISTVSDPVVVLYQTIQSAVVIMWLCQWVLMIVALINLFIAKRERASSGYGRTKGTEMN